jgi:TonB-linked SusC/RagA family outer membrane protein
MSMMRKLLLTALLSAYLLNTATAQDRVVTGRVTSSDDGTTLPGVSVLVQGTTKGTATDANGVYSLSLAAGENTLVFSFIGYKTQTAPVGAQSSINIALETDITALEEVVVVGYGTQKKLDITGAVVQVKGEEISKQASINPISGLQGKVAGVQIVNSGAPGAAPQIIIRGTGTVFGNAAPLYVVDGVWYEDITFLNPADIENISVLKDASSEAIYGVRAANGVVLITTKKGTPNSLTTINYSGFVGSQVATNTVEMATGPQFATMINELDVANGQPARYADPNSFGNTDWTRQILRAAPISNHQISVAGGGDKSTFNLSLGYLNQKGTVKTNSFERYTARLQNDFQPLDFVKMGYNITGTFNSSDDIPGSIFNNIYVAGPNVPVYYEDGTYGDPSDFSLGGSNLFNPQVTIDFYDQTTKNYRITGNFFTEVKLADYLTFRTSFGGDFGQTETKRFLPVYAATLTQRNPITRLDIGRGELRNTILENTLTFNKVFGNHGVNFIIGQTAQQWFSYGLNLTARNMPNSSTGDHYLSLGDLNSRLVNDNGEITKVASYFGRLNYSFNEKYVVNATLRADGTSKFSGDQRWGYFPSFGAGWIISEENFLKDQTFVRNLKLRASWGKVGNVSVPANLSILKVTQIDDFAASFGGGPAGVGATINTIVPPTTFWERGVGTDLGLEASLLNDKLFVEVDFYNRKTEQAIFPIPILGSIGTSGSTIVGNQATFQNQGLEFLLRWNDNISSDLSYSISANMGINENKVLEVATGRNAIEQSVGVTGGATNTRTVVGSPIGVFYGLEVIGIFQNQNEINNYQSTDGSVIQPSAAPGDFKYADLNDDGVIDNKDRKVLGNPNPKFTYGISTNWRYKAFDLMVDFQGVAGVEIYNANLGFRFGTENFSREFFENRWRGEGTSNDYPSANIGGGQNFVSNSFYVENGSYFRVRNIQLGYELPASIVNKLKMTKARVYVNAQNALNFFKYRGFSPEVGGAPTRAGVDLSVYPLYATYNAGVNITF